MCSLACCCGRAESILAPQADSRKKSAPTPAPSARSVFGTRRDSPHRARRSRRPRAIRPLRQLVNVLPRAPWQPRRGRCGSAASPAPSGRPYHARGSLLAEPANPTSPRPTLSRVGHRVIGVLRVPRKRRARELPPVSRETLYTASINCREPHQFTTTPLLCQVGCPGSLYAPRLARSRWVRSSKTTIVRE